MDAGWGAAGTNWLGDDFDQWGATAATLQDEDELWMAPNPALDSMGMSPPANNTESGGAAADATAQEAASAAAVQGPPIAAAAGGPGAGTDTDVGSELCEVCGSGSDDEKVSPHRVRTLSFSSVFFTRRAGLSRAPI